MTTTTTEVSTRPSAKADAQKTALTINWEGMTEEDLRALAQQALIVKLQGSWRKNESIPTEATINVVDYKVGVRATRSPADAMTLINKLSAEEKAALLAKLTAQLAG